MSQKQEKLRSVIVSRNQQRETLNKLQEKQVKSVCIACGSRNVITCNSRKKYKEEPSHYIQCRCCKLISPNFNQTKPPNGFQDGYQTLDKAQALRMADELIESCTHQHTKKKLQCALDYAQGDFALIVHKYVPIVLDIFAHIISTYGFTSTLHGVMEAVRELQTHAKDDEQYTQRLINIRKLLTPTGAWIREDAEADQDELKAKQIEQEELHKQREEAMRAESLAQENAKKIRLRAKKLALGLDPSLEQLPKLENVPPSMIVTGENKRVRLQVNCKFTRKIQWYFNGKPITSEGDMVEGIHRCTLVIRKLTKRVVGEYFCVCENEEGSKSTPTCQVLIASLTARRLMERKLRALATSSLLKCTKERMITSLGGSVTLYDTNTLIPLKIVPAIPAANNQALAWNSSRQLLIVASSPPSSDRAVKSVELQMHSLDFLSQDVNVAAASTNSKHVVNSTAKSGVDHKTKSEGRKAEQKVTSNQNVFSQLVISKSISTMSEVYAAEFAANGELLILSDLKYYVEIYEVTPSFSFLLRNSLELEKKTRVCHLAASTQQARIALSFRNQSFVNLYDFGKHINPSSPQAQSTCRLRRLDCQFSINRTAFDHHGFFLAIAEYGCMKSWVSIINTFTQKPTRKRFLAHVGKISGLQWTKKTSLLATSGYDGYIKLWDTVTYSCILSVNLDVRGIHSMVLMEEEAVILVQSYTDCRLQTRRLHQLLEFEASRLIELSEYAACIQKNWKGRQTRQLIAKYIKSSETNR